MNFGASMSKICSKTVLNLKRYSPEMLVIGGIGAMVGATVMAVQATKSDAYMDVIIDYNETMKHIEEAEQICEKSPTKTDENGNEVERYPQELRIADRKTMKRRYLVGMVKTYSPSVAVGILGIASILCGFKILKSRNLALVAAYNIIDKAFKDYRGRVISELGKDKDQHFMYDTEEVLTTKTIENEDGTKTKVKVTDQVLKGTVVSMYGRIYNKENSSQYVENPAFNWLFLKKKREYLNDRLNINGHVFLNEAYDELGMTRTTAGSVVGWVKKGDGDGYISFGPWCESITEVEAAGFGSDILVDFNVDGVIYDLVDSINAK